MEELEGWTFESRGEYRGYQQGLREVVEQAQG